MRIESKQKIVRTLKFVEVLNSKGEFMGGGIRNSSKHIEEEVWVEIMPDNGATVLPEEFTTGRIQIHMGGTRRAFEELGVFFLALSRYRPSKDGYSMSFDLVGQEGSPVALLTLYLPMEEGEEKKRFYQIHTVASAWISKDGRDVVEKTTKPRKASHTSMDKPDLK